MLSNLGFRYRTWTDQYFRREAGVAGANNHEGSNRQADGSGCIVIMDNANGTIGPESRVVVRNCQIGGALTQTNWTPTTSNTKRYVHAIYAQNGNQLVVEDCLIWGAYQIGKIARMKRVVFRRNLFRGLCDRGITCFTNDEPGYNPIYEVYDNVLTDVISQADWRASHFDFMQFGVGGNQEPASFFDVYVARNRIDQSVILTYGNYAETKDTHGCVGTGDHTNPLLRGVLENNLIVLSGIEADSWARLASSQTGSSYGLIVRKNTFAKQVRYDTPSSADGNPAYPCRINAQLAGRKQLVDCIAGTFYGSFSSKSGCAGARHNLQSARPDWESSGPDTVHPYPDIFAGPFSWNSQQGRWLADDMSLYDPSDYQAAKNWLDQVFAPKPGGPGMGIGHLS